MEFRRKSEYAVEDRNIGVVIFNIQNVMHTHIKDNKFVLSLVMSRWIAYFGSQARSYQRRKH